MTLDEAKKLEHGDRVLVEMEVMKDSFFGETVSAGAVYIRAVGMENVAAAVKPEFIRKKLEPTTRRKFKALDIVFAQGAYWIVGQNERDDGSVLVGMMGAISRYKHKDLELICAAENREDRKGGRMSKHPTSELSPRDIAAMDYGCYHFDVLDSFKRRRTWGNSYLRAKIKDAREARARIFRSCGNCTQMLSFVGIWNGEERYNCRCCGWVPESTGITCPHYKERREP